MKRFKSGNIRYVLAIALVVGAFFGAYAFAQARSGGSGATGIPSDGIVADLVTGSGDAGAACACCGTGEPPVNGISGDVDEGQARVEGGVQRIEVDLSTGIYSPNTIKLAAGVPTEITFGQSSGCTGQVMSEELGFFEDLTAGPRTVKLPALEPGEYSFTCGMQMVFGKIVVE